jgi:hypothetical protein
MCQIEFKRLLISKHEIGDQKMIILYILKMALKMDQVATNPNSSSIGPAQSLHRSSTVGMVNPLTNKFFLMPLYL